MLDSTVTTQVQEALDSLNTALEDGDARAASALLPPTAIGAIWSPCPGT